MGIGYGTIMPSIQIKNIFTIQICCYESYFIDINKIKYNIMTCKQHTITPLDGS